MLDQSREALAAKPAAMADEDCRREIPGPDRAITLGARLFYLYSHETYHTGQTEPPRQLAGTDDQVN